MEDVLLFLDQLEDMNEKYLEADAYYRGAPPEIFSNKRIKEFLGIESGQFKENFSAIPVDAMSARMAINGFYVPNSDEATDFLTDLWTNSKMHIEFAGFLRDLNKYGEGYIELGLTEDDEVDICPSSVTTSQMVYFAGDLRVKLFFGKLTYIKLEDDNRLRVVTLKYSDRIERWIETAPDSRLFEPDLYEDPETGETGWEYHEFGEVPAFHFRNETPHGSPEHLQAYGAQDQIIKIIMNEMGVIDFAGLPQRYFISAAGKPGQGALFGKAGEDPAILDDDNIAPASGPGSMLVLPEGETGTYAAGDPAAFVAAKDSALRAMAVLTNTPIRFFSDPGGQHPSGESLRASDARFKSKILNREDSYGLTLGEVFRLALEVAGYVNAEQPVIKWQPQAVDDSVDALEIAEKKINLGIPKYYVLLELGYPEDLVSQWGYSPEMAPEPNSINPTSTRD